LPFTSEDAATERRLPFNGLGSISEDFHALATIQRYIFQERKIVGNGSDKQRPLESMDIHARGLGNAGERLRELVAHGSLHDSFRGGAVPKAGAPFKRAANVLLDVVNRRLPPKLAGA